MVMPTWLFGSFSVTTEIGAAITPIVSGPLQSAGVPASDQVGVGIGDGLGTGGGLAKIGPEPGSSGTTNDGVFGVGLGGLSPGSRGMLRVSLRNQLLLAPLTTSGGAVYQRLPGTPASACEMNVCMGGEATNTPSEPYTIV